jgi:threonine dehydratase
MTRAGLRLGTADVLAAADRIHDHVHRTPMRAMNSRILLKSEHLQRAGSFKIRGAANAILGYAAETSVTGVVTGSSGNHGIAVATLGRSLGIGVTVVMAAGASTAKAAALRRLGARVVEVDGGVAARDQFAQEYAALTGAAMIPSSDHDLVVAGQGTVALEVFRDVPAVDVIFVPTGGGGLLAGVCLAAGTRPVRIVGVEPVSARRYALSLAEDRPVRLPPSTTIADGLRGQCPGKVPFPIIRERVDDLVGVTDDAIAHAMRVLGRAGVAAEPSGSVALAGALETGFTGRAVVVVSGGNTTAALAAVARNEKGSP